MENFTSLGVFGVVNKIEILNTLHHDNKEFAEIRI